MDIAVTLIEILKYTIPALIVLASSSLIVKRFLINQTQRKQLALFQDAQDITLRLRLGAYERLAVYTERISPRSLITRVYDSSMTVMDLRFALTTTILTEFEHNLSQQIYVSRNVWETVKNVKEQEINMINQITKSLPGDAPAKELSTRILDMLLSTEGETPTEVALHIINQEARTIMSYGAM